jgi:hypothetical protein
VDELLIIDLVKNTGANKLSLACKCLAMKQMAAYGGVACSRYSVANRGSHPNTREQKQG